MRHKLLAVLCVTAVSASLLGGCGSEKKTEEKETAGEVQGNELSDGSDEEAEEETKTEEAASEEKSSEDSSKAEGVTLDVSKPLSGTHHAEMILKDYGTIKMELDADTAPLTVTNFVKLVQEDFYDGLTFHRIINDFMMQGGDPEGNGTGGAEEKEWKTIFPIQRVLFLWRVLLIMTAPAPSSLLFRQTAHILMEIMLPLAM